MCFIGIQDLYFGLVFLSTVHLLSTRCIIKKRRSFHKNPFFEYIIEFLQSFVRLDIVFSALQVDCYRFVVKAKQSAE